MTHRVKILLADDHVVLRAGLVALLDRESDIEVVAEASDGIECQELARLWNPDIVLMDLNMPRCGGLDALVALREELPDIKVLVLTMHDDLGYLRHVLAAGGSGFVLKQSASDELLTAIRTVREGGVFIHPPHAKMLADAPDPSLQDRHPTSSLVGAHGTLSEREAEVFRLLALGHTNGEIADIMFLSVKTVETYKSRLTRKLNATTRADLVRLALDLDVLR